MNVELDKTDRELHFLHKKIRFSLMNPLNFDKEKKKIMKDKMHDPQLTYAPLPSYFPSLRHELNSLHFDDSIFGKLLQQKRNELLKMVLMLQSRGTPAFSSAALNLYGRPSKELVVKAKKLLELNGAPLPTEYTGISTVKKFLDALLNQGLHWKVKEKEMIVGAAFDVSERILFINPNRRFSDNDIKRLIVHEIGTHIVRAEHAKKHRHKLFLIGFPHYLPTEEGLAVYNEQRAGLLTNDILKKYAARVVAVDLALTASFSAVYNSLLEFFNKEDAFTLTIRSKRGISDTSKVGAFTKDYFYLQGYYDVQNYAKKGGSIDALYTGKVGIEHVPFLKYLE